MTDLVFRLSRQPSSSECTIGDMWASEDGETTWARLCWSLEDVVREVPGQPVASWKIHGKTAIPRGRYRVIVDHSEHFGKDLPHLLDVPGFDGVRIHGGNTAADTEGCVLVAHHHPTEDVIQGSAMTDTIMPLLAKHGNEAEIIIEGGIA